MTWAQRLKRVFRVDIETCRRCGGRVKVIRTSQPGAGHKIYPYLLRELPIERATHVWASDICYIPMAKGFMYLVVIMDWHSCRVLSWRVSKPLDTQFCIEALQEALQRFGPPEIFNTDSEYIEAGSCWWSEPDSVRHGQAYGAGRLKVA